MPCVKNSTHVAVDGVVLTAETRRPLTTRQKEVLSLISESIDRRGYPPTLREIGERLGIRGQRVDEMAALEEALQREKETQLAWFRTGELLRNLPVPARPIVKEPPIQ